MRKAEKKKKIEMVNKVDSAIISVCNNIEQENTTSESYPQTVAALAVLLLARAVLN